MPHLDAENWRAGAMKAHTFAMKTRRLRRALAGALFQVPAWEYGRQPEKRASRRIWRAGRAILN
jgi:hypothetical protein